MSYTNQMDHELLDRQLIRDELLRLSRSTLRASPGPADRAEHLRQLKSLCESDLERAWLDFLEEHNLRLPDAAQKLIEACNTRADFYYSDQGVAIYIDGPAHDQPDVILRDNEVGRCLIDLGHTPVRFPYQQGRWAAICAQHPYVFGPIDINSYESLPFVD